MTLGIPLSYFLMASAQRGSWLKRASFVSFLLSIAGAVASFKRGTFLSLLLVLGYMFFRSQNKARYFARGCAVVFVVLILAVTLFSGFFERYENEMSTIVTKGANEGTGKDRMYLWTQALKMFADNPVLGIGPGCFGFKIQSYITREEADQWGVRYQMYGRAIHNIYIEILSEMGSLGFIAFLSLLVVFRKRNLAVRQAVDAVKQPYSSMHYYALAIEGGMIALLVNGYFYNLTYSAWLWDLMILNTILYQRIKHLEGGLMR